jgi:hypothetical protein
MADLETEIAVAFNGAWRRLPAGLWEAATRGAVPGRGAHRHQRQHLVRGSARAVWIRTTLGATILGAAVIDDVLRVIVLSIALGLAGEGELPLTLAKLALFLPAAWLIGDWLIPGLMRVEQYLPQADC